VARRPDTGHDLAAIRERHLNSSMRCERRTAVMARTREARNRGARHGFHSQGTVRAPASSEQLGSTAGGVAPIKAGSGYSNVRCHSITEFVGAPRRRIGEARRTECGLASGLTSNAEPRRPETRVVPRLCVRALPRSVPPRGHVTQHRSTVAFRSALIAVSAKGDMRLWVGCR
jgi:hypothetical protein